MRKAGLILAALSLVLSSSAPVGAGVVQAADYSSFWIWGGVKPQPVLSQAGSLYILQGQVVERKQGAVAKVTVVPMGMTVARSTKSKIWLVYRADTLRWTPEIVQTLIMQLKRWQLSGNPVVGLQIDFDVKTKHLQEYVQFLKTVRSQLPQQYQLSITGLLDWARNGDIDAINGLKPVVNEVVVQTYQGRKTISNYQAYLPALKRLTVPFKIGLIQNGEWQALADLEQMPSFHGYVVFLQNQGPAKTRESSDTPRDCGV